jgi:hypothetical protein
VGLLFTGVFNFLQEKEVETTTQEIGKKEEKTPKQAKARGF